MSRIASARLEPIVDKLPADFEDMRSEARAEGYRFLDRLAIDWESGLMRFDRPGEALLAAHRNGVLAAVGGITVDPFVRPRHRRVRIVARRQDISRISRAGFQGDE